MKKPYWPLIMAMLAIQSCAPEPEACVEYEVLGNKVNFDATCSHHAAQYTWDFGDGSTSNGATPQHTYTSAGDYDVSLTVETKRGKTSQNAFTVHILSNGSAILNTHFDGVYSNLEYHTSGTIGARTYAVVVRPSTTRTSEAIFSALWQTGAPVTAVIAADTTTFSIHRQTLQSGIDIVSTAGTINSDGSRIDLNYQVLDAATGAVLDACTAVMTK